MHGQSEIANPGKEREARPSALGWMEHLGSRRPRALPDLSPDSERLTMSRAILVGSTRRFMTDFRRILAMHCNHRVKLFRVGLFVLLVPFGLVTSFAPHAYGADEPPRPAEKDSSTRARPKEVTLTTSVEPAEAKPGDTVTLRVTAKLKPGYHIYTQAKTQEGDGPRKTLFDLFDTAGLEVTGNWKADKKPESRAEPAFDNQVFEYFEEEVTWSIPLKIPEGTAAGKKEIRVQASYQICNAQSCSFPGRWTLPAATLTVQGADGSGGGASLKPDTSKPQVVLAPVEKDSPARLRPTGVTLTPSVEPAEAHPGETVTYKVAAHLNPGLHIYAVGNPDTNQSTSIPTTFDFFDPGGLKVSKEWKADRAPEVRPDPASNDQLLQYFENEVTWSTTLSIPPDAAPGKRILRSQAGYQVCDEHSCFPPGQWTLNDVTLTIVPGAARAASPPPTKPVQASAAAPPKPAVAGGSTTASKVEPAPAPAAIAPLAAAPAPASSGTVEPPVAGELAAPAAGQEPASATSRGSAAPVSEIARRAQQGLIPFLIASALGGLFALLMPCVWPMVPITVNFFVKQGQPGPMARPRATAPGWRSPTAWRSLASSRPSACSSRSSSPPVSCRPWPTIPG